MTQPLNRTRLTLLLLATLLTTCEQPKKPAPPPKATTAAPAQNNQHPSPAASDIAAVSNAMHGAANQQPDDAPKDPYGEPYIIGTLGGVPVNLPSSVVRFVEYVDSPGWDMDKIRSYNPPTRNYQSIIKAFDFAFRNSDGALYDENKRDLVKQYRAERSAGGDDWVRVIISAAPVENPRKYPLDYLYETSFQKWATAVEEPYAFTGEYRYGLEYYVIPGINPKTQKSWREKDGVEDLFIYKGSDGHVVTYIKCSNHNVPSPPCTHYSHPPKASYGVAPLRRTTAYCLQRRALSETFGGWLYFEMLSPMKLGNITLSYHRQHLKSWKEIQEKAKAFILTFPAKTD